MTKKAILSNFLWIPKEAVKKTGFLKKWQFEIELLKTSQGKLKQQQISALREQFGKDLDIEDISEEDVLVLKNWSDIGNWYALARGDMKKCRKLLKHLDLKTKDRRAVVPWDEDLDALKMHVPLRDYQVKPYQDWVDAGHGIFMAKPGFGKTVLMIKEIIRLKQKCIVLVNTNPLKAQFIERFRHGAPNADGSGHLALTNCAALEEELGQEVIGAYKSPKKKWVPGTPGAAGTTYPVTIATWQSFIGQRGTAALEELSKEFGFLLVDEAHTFAAPKPGGVINQFHAKTRRGVTATPKRKDQYDQALYDIIGTVTATGERPVLDSTATMIATGVAYQGAKYARQGEWSYMLNHLYKSKTRTDLIYDWVTHDLRAGRKVLIIGERVTWLREFSKRLTSAGFRSEAAVGATKENERAEIIKRMLDDETDVICASKVFKAGVDIPCLDTLHLTCPGANTPQLEQTLGRITRPYEGKQEPVARYYVDEGHGMLYGCANKTAAGFADLGVNVITIPTGTKPGTHKIADGYKTDVEEASKKKVNKLRRASNRSGQSVSKLVVNKEKADFEATRYRNRLKGKR